MWVGGGGVVGGRAGQRARSICKRKHRRQRRARGTSLSLSAFTIIVSWSYAVLLLLPLRLLKSLDRQSSKWRGERILIERSFSSINRIDIKTVESGQLNCYNSSSSLLSIISLRLDSHTQKHTANWFGKQSAKQLKLKKITLTKNTLSTLIIHTLTTNHNRYSNK